MELYEIMTNINRKNPDIEIKKAIEKTKTYFKGLTKERMCKVYSSALYDELVTYHIPCRLISTYDLGLDYEHVFVLISSKTITGGGYYVADLTFSQFPNSVILKELLANGYQKMNDLEFSLYLKIINGKDLDFTIPLEDTFYGTLKEHRKR